MVPQKFTDNLPFTIKFTGKNPPGPAGPIFAGKLSAGETFLKGDPIMRHRRCPPACVSSASGRSVFNRSPFHHVHT